MQSCLALTLIALVLFASAYAPSDGLIDSHAQATRNECLHSPASNGFKESIFGPDHAHVGIVQECPTVLEVGLPL